jgi:transcriptional regulator with XRE-family HTH domain
VVGDLIRATRKARGWTQQVLAQQAGVSRRHLIALEQGANVSLDVLRRVAAALDLYEIDLGEVRLVSRPRQTTGHEGSIAKNAVDGSPWLPQLPRREGRYRSLYPVAAEISRLEEPRRSREFVSVPTAMIEIDEILVRVADDSFERSGFASRDLLVVQLRPDQEIATGEIVLLTASGKVDVGRWWEKRRVRRISYETGRPRDVSRSRDVVLHGVINCRLEGVDPAPYRGWLED